MSNQTQPPKQRGCFFYGCLSLAIIALVIALFVGLGLYFAKRTIASFTDTAPARFEAVVYPEARMRELRTRLQNFQQNLETSAEPVELILSADDLNALISRETGYKERIFLKIEDDKVKGQISWPLPDIGPFKLRGRYLNGTAAFKVAIDNGKLDVRIDQVMVRDKPLPAVILSEMKKTNLAEEAVRQDNPDSARILNRIDRLEIREGNVIIRSKPGKPGPAQP